MNKMRKIFIGVFRVLAICIALMLVLWIFQPILDRMDSDANQKFAELATKLKIEGKSQTFMRKNFGKPRYEFKTHDGEDVWVYTPGPMLALWNSECKVVFSKDQKTVLRWGVESD